MIHYNIKNYLLSNGFKEIQAWNEFKHENGLLVMVDEHEWAIENVNEDWAESGSLNETSPLYRIIKAECETTATR